tara:strand:+ start:6062 stop:6586 length:525 start_codon:yes stop_codon:yes gene_type:complete
MPVIRIGAVYGEVYYRAYTAPADGGPPSIATLYDFAFRRHGPLFGIAARARVELPPMTEVSPAPPIPAYVGQDKWLVLCPTCGKDVQFVWMDDLIYMCANCWNYDADGQWRRVKVPTQRTAIEAALGMRGDPGQRNWLPGETVKMLKAETIDPNSKGRRVVKVSELVSQMKAAE